MKSAACAQDLTLLLLTCTEKPNPALPEASFQCPSPGGYRGLTPAAVPYPARQLADACCEGQSAWIQSDSLGSVFHFTHSFKPCSFRKSENVKMKVKAMSEIRLLTWAPPVLVTQPVSSKVLFFAQCLILSVGCSLYPALSWSSLRSWPHHKEGCHHSSPSHLLWPIPRMAAAGQHFTHPCVYLARVPSREAGAAWITISKTAAKGPVSNKRQWAHILSLFRRKDPCLSAERAFPAACPMWSGWL